MATQTQKETLSYQFGIAKKRNPKLSAKGKRRNQAINHPWKGAKFGGAEPGVRDFNVVLDDSIHHKMRIKRHGGPHLP